MPIDINAILNETRGKDFELYEEHVNPVFVKVLRTLGFNRSWVRGEGAYLWDETGTRYLDFLTNWGVFNFGRRHPTIRGACSRCWTPISPDGSVSTLHPLRLRWHANS